MSLQNIDTFREVDRRGGDPIKNLKNAKKILYKIVSKLCCQTDDKNQSGSVIVVHPIRKIIKFSDFFFNP